MDKTPLFSIIIPAYKSAQYIGQTLRSIYQQTEKNYEIIVIDDGSPDNLLEVLARETDPRLRVVSQPNGGVSRARNRGIQEAKGTYLAFLDSDDVWLPFHLEKARIFFEKYPRYHWYATHIIRQKEIHDDKVQKMESIEENFYSSNWFLEFAPVPLASSVVIKKEEGLKYLHFPEDIKMFEDNIAWSRFAIKAGAVGTMNQAAAIYRQHDSSASRDYQREWERGAKELGLDAFLIQQELMTDKECPIEAKLYFQARSLSNWRSQLTQIAGRISMRELKVRRTITGRFYTILLLICAALVKLSTKAVRKILDIKEQQLKRKMDQLHKKERHILP